MYKKSVTLLTLLFAVSAQAFWAGDARVTAQPPSFPASKDFAGCLQHLPRTMVVAPNFDPKWRVTALCANGYGIFYSPVSKTPLLVFERLNKATLQDALDEVRTDVFFEDPRLPAKQRATLDDYRSSGYDRGHMSPAANQTNSESMAQSFVLSNIVPQDPTHNRKVWSKIESDTRKYARRADGDVFVFTGPVFDDLARPRTIGASHVWVPSRIFKVVYDAKSGRMWAHVHQNNAQAKAGPPMSYEQFVQTTGIAIFR